MKKDLFIDLEWFIGGDIFLIGWCRSSKEYGQLYDETLTAEAFQDLLDLTTGRIYFYGPDIGIAEKYFDIDIRTNYECINLLKVFKDNIPGLKNYKLATVEKLYGVKRNRNEYKANIFAIFQDWRRPQVKSLVLQYNREDVINLCKLKNIVFAQYDVEDEYLLQVRLAGVQEIKKDHIVILPCDLYRGASYGRVLDGRPGNDPNITAQMVVAAKFHQDLVSLYRMIVLMADQVKGLKFDYITSVNNRDSKFDLARALARGIAKRVELPYRELFSDQNKTCSSIIKNRTVLIIDDVIYKGTTMQTAINAASKKQPLRIHFLAFGKSQRYAY